MKLTQLCNRIGHSCNAGLFPHPAQVVALASTTIAPVIQFYYRTSGPLCLFNADQKKTTLRTSYHKAGSLTPLHTPQLKTASEEEKEEVKTDFWDTGSKPLMSSPGTYPSKGISLLPLRRPLNADPPSGSTLTKWLLLLHTHNEKHKLYILMTLLGWGAAAGLGQLLMQ